MFFIPEPQVPSAADRLTVTGPVVQPSLPASGAGEGEAVVLGAVVSGSKVNWSAPLVALVPSRVVTVTSTVPRACAGATAVSDSGDVTFTDDDAALPNFTLVPLSANSVPVIATVGAQALLSSGAWFGVTAVTVGGNRKSTRLNSSHRTISYAVFCLKKKKK